MSAHNGADDRDAVRLVELTLRQLGHMEADMTFEEKVYFLSRLDRARVPETMVWGLDADAEALALACRDHGFDLKLFWFAKVYFPAELDTVLERAAKVGVPLSLGGRGSDFALDALGWTREQMLDASVSAVSKAKDLGLEIAVGLSYATQADAAYLEEFAGAVAAAGADRVKLPDSLGVANPRTYGELVTRVRRIVDIPIQVHCHDDYGLATANAVACVEAGARYVDAIVNGHDPERAGLAALDEVAVVLELQYGYATGIKLDELTSLSRLHEQMTGMRVADNKPIVGRRAFNYRVSGGAAPSAPKRDDFYSSPHVTPFDPAIVGNQRRFLLGKFSGGNEISRRLQELDLSVTNGELETVVRLVNRHGTQEMRAVTDPELRRFVDVARVGAR